MVTRERVKYERHKESLSPHGKEEICASKGENDERKKKNAKSRIKPKRTGACMKS
jgi:hypothetical protein